jgi:hypothetical protein
LTALWGKIVIYLLKRRPRDETVKQMANGTRLTLNSSGLLELDDNRRPALLIMEDGTTFEGKAFGADTTAVGELVFNTSLMGYQEVLTDPSYAGQSNHTYLS